MKVSIVFNGLVAYVLLYSSIKLVSSEVSGWNDDNIPKKKTLDDYTDEELVNMSLEEFEGLLDDTSADAELLRSVFELKKQNIELKRKVQKRNEAIARGEYRAPEYLQPENAENSTSSKIDVIEVIEIRSPKAKRGVKSGRRYVDFEITGEGNDNESHNEYYEDTEPSHYGRRHHGSHHRKHGHHSSRHWDHDVDHHHRGGRHHSSRHGHHHGHRVHSSRHWDHDVDHHHRGGRHHSSRHGHHHGHRVHSSHHKGHGDHGHHRKMKEFPLDSEDEVIVVHNGNGTGRKSAKTWEDANADSMELLNSQTITINDGGKQKEIQLEEVIAPKRETHMRGRNL